MPGQITHDHNIGFISAALKLAGSAAKGIAKGIKKKKDAKKGIPPAGAPGAGAPGSTSHGGTATINITNPPQPKQRPPAIPMDKAPWRYTYDDIDQVEGDEIMINGRAGKKVGKGAKAILVPGGITRAIIKKIKERRAKRRAAKGLPPKGPSKLKQKLQAAGKKIKARIKKSKIARKASMAKSKTARKARINEAKLRIKKRIALRKALASGQITKAQYLSERKKLSRIAARRLRKAKAGELSARKAAKLAAEAQRKAQLDAFKLQIAQQYDPHRLTMEGKGVTS